MSTTTHHGTCVLIGPKAVLLRGPSGVGKSRLALQLLHHGSEKSGPFCRLVGDDRLHLLPANNRLVARVPDNLAGLLEVRGLGILRVPFEPRAQIGLVIDLMDAAHFAEKAVRLPEADDLVTTLSGIRLPYLQLDQDNRAAVSTILTAMNLAGNPPSPIAGNPWTGLAETDQLVLSQR